jgi:hypothetical protein
LATIFSEISLGQLNLEVKKLTTSTLPNSWAVSSIISFTRFFLADVRGDNNNLLLALFVELEHLAGLVVNDRVPICPRGAMSFGTFVDSLGKLYCDSLESRALELEIIESNRVSIVGKPEGNGAANALRASSNNGDRHADVGF